MKIAAVCVLYRPDRELLRRNLEACLPQVERVYLVDNSEPAVERPQAEVDSDKIRYLGCGRNMGIAWALNRGCEAAAADGFDWVLTLDQDSVVPPDLIARYTGFIRQPREGASIGMLTCAMKVCAGDKSAGSAGVEEVTLCYTSGAFMSLAAYRRVGGFEEGLFIDGVDFEYCLRLKRAGYGIYRLNEVVLDHRLGNSVPYEWFGRHLFYITHHNYIRRYYMMRNALWIGAHYGGSYPSVRYGLRPAGKAVMKILLFEKDKFRKFRSMWRGYRDYKRGVSGKYRWND